MQTTTGQKVVCISALLLLLLCSAPRNSAERLSNAGAEFAALRTSCGTLEACSELARTARTLMTASWYGKKFQGRRTSSGERFDRFRLTAAHKTLPLGSVVRLTVPATGRTVVVRINDRGPWLKGRDFDLSEAAAVKLGIHEEGIAAVEMSLYK